MIMVRDEFSRKQDLLDRLHNAYTKGLDNELVIDSLLYLMECVDLEDELE